MTESDGSKRDTGAAESEPPGRPPTPRSRFKSAALWGAVGFFSFLALVQGYVLLGGDLPFRYAALFAIGLVVGATSGGIAYLTEHQLVAKERV